MKKIRLRNMFYYMKKVFRIDEKIDKLTDTRMRRGILHQNVLTIVLIGFIMQKPSFNSMFNHNSFKKRAKNLFSKGTKMPGLDAARAILENVKTDELKLMHDEIIEKIRTNKTFREGTIDGLLVAGIDGVELFNSYNKCCDGCLERKRKKKRGETKEYYHKAVVCMTVGTDPHIILGEEMLAPRDGHEKEEGEQTGGKRLIENLYNKHKHFADVIVGDALYLNAPFIKAVTDRKMDVVIRAKDTNRIILQDALGIAKKMPVSKTFTNKKVTVKVKDIKGFEMDGLEKPLRFLQFEETRIRTIPIIERNKDGTVKKTFKQVEEHTTIWVFTTLDVPAETIWKIIHKRWDIEDNGFHQLKTYYHASHCFDHNATENIFLLIIMAFNLREMYLYRRLRGFRASNWLRVDVTNEWLDDLLVCNYKEFFQFNSG